jgi:hypothetical protein
MLRLTSIVLIALVSFAAQAREKQPDIRNVAPQVGHKSVLIGSLTAGSPTYDRAAGADVSLECSAPFTDSANDGVHLDIICMESIDFEPVELMFSASGTTLADPVLTIYCQAIWDPSMPLDFGVAYDDDSGEGLLSAITYDMDVRFFPGDVYWVVVSTYAAGMIGNYELVASDNLSLCSAVSVETTAWGALKSTYR